MPKKTAPRLLEDLWTATHQKPEGYHALKTKHQRPEGYHAQKTTPRLPEDLWTATHQRPESYHAQKTGSKSARRPLDYNK